MTEFIDLSHNITNNMPVHPYDDLVKLYQNRFLEVNECNNFKFVLLYTNYSDKYGTEEYFTKHPTIDKELVDFFIEKR